MVYKSPLGGGGGGSSGNMNISNNRVSQQQQGFKLPNDPVAILWDIENCPVPNEVSAENVAGNVRAALNTNLALRGSVTMFSAYGDFNHFPRKVREGCQRTGVNLIDVPNSKKDASDKAILVDMFLFALDNPPPSTIFLISGDVDFAPALHKLGQRGYTVVLAIPAGFVSGSLCSAGRYVWDWTSLARGMGLVPVQPRMTRESLDTNYRYSDESGDESFRSAGGNILPVSSFADWNPVSSAGYDTTNRTTPPPTSVTPPVSTSFMEILPTLITSPSVSSPNVNQEPAEGADGDPDSPDSDSMTAFVRPGDLSGLKKQLIKLLSLHAGSVKLVQLPPEYSRLYGRPLYLSDYGSLKLVHLLEKLRDALAVKGDSKDRTVHLTKAGMRLATKYRNVWGSASKSKGEKKEPPQPEDSPPPSALKEVREEPATSSSRDVVDEEVVVYMSKVVEPVDLSDSASASHDEQPEEEIDEVEIQEVVSIIEEETAKMARTGMEVPRTTTTTGVVDSKQEGFRQNLQELLVSYACHIHLSDLAELYRERYADEMDYGAFGVEENDLETLLNKVSDVGVVRDVQGRKMLVANLGLLPRLSLARATSENILI